VFNIHTHTHTAVFACVFMFVCSYGEFSDCNKFYSNAANGWKALQWDIPRQVARKLEKGASK